MDQEEQEHESRWQELPNKPRMGQVTYWHQKPEVSPDEDLRLEVERLINKYVSGCKKVISLGVDVVVCLL